MSTNQCGIDDQLAAVQEKEAFRKIAVPEVKKLIAEKFGAEGEDMLGAFPEAVK